MEFISAQKMSRLLKEFIQILRAVTNIPIQLKYVISKRLGTHKMYEVILFPTQHNQQEYKSFLKKIYFHKNFSVVENEKQLAGIIRGFFLSCGYIKSPEKAYAMDFFCGY